MTFYFAWVPNTATTFSASYKRHDEDVLSFQISHEEGDFASLRVDVRNPKAGLLALTRKKWCWLSDDSGPLFFGRVVGLPQEISAEVISMTFVAKPKDYQAAKDALADTMKQTRFFDPLFIDEGRRQEADTVLEARPAVWCIDRVTHALTASNIIDGEDGTIDFTSGAFYDSLACTYTGAPQRKVIVEAQVGWTQYGFGSFNVGFDNISTYTGDGLLADWPKAGSDIGAGWKVKESFARDTYSRLNSTNINDQDGNVAYRLYRWTINGTVRCQYEASRQRTEYAKFRIKSDVQHVVRDSGDEEPIVISVTGTADELVDDDGATMPIKDVRRRAYFTTNRGQKSIEYLANIAASRLLASARCVEVSFELPFSYAADLSLSKNGTINDSRLPGGTATGKIKSYTIFADGESGRTGCSVTLASTPGNGNSLSTSSGSPTYADAYGDSYQVSAGETLAVVDSASGSPSVTVTVFDDVLPVDDGLDLFNMTADTCVIDKVINMTAFEQQSFIFMNSGDTNSALSNHPTRLGIRLVPVTGGPFETKYEITTSDLMVPKLIDLEAEAA